MPKSTKKKRTISQLSKFRNAFRNTKSPWATLSKFKNKVEITNLPEMHSYYLKHPKYGEQLKEVLKPSSPSTILYHKPLPASTILREIYWAASLLQVFSKEITEFVKLSDTYNKYIEEQKFQEALVVLDNIEKNICFSEWGIERKIGLYNRIGGLEQNKQYLNQLNKQYDLSSYLGFIAYQISTRNEGAINISWLKKTHEEAMTEWPISDEDKEFFKYKLYRPLCKNQNYSNHLAQEYNSSIIDLYESTVFAFGRMIESDLISNDKLFKIAPRLLSISNDLRMKKALFLLSKDATLLEQFPIEDTTVSDHLRKNELEKSLDISTRIVEGNKHNIYSKVVHAKVLSDAKTKYNGKDDIVTDTKEILDKKSTIYSHYNNLVKTSLNATPQYYEFSISNFLTSELSSSPFTVAKDTDLLEFIYSDFISPSQIALIPDLNTRKSFADLLISKYNKSSTLDYYINTYTREDTELCAISYSEDYQHLSRIEKISPIISSSETLELAKKLVSSNIPRFKRYGGRYYAQSLLELKEYEILLNFVGTCLIEDNGSKYSLPIIKIGNILDKEIMRDYRAKIDVAIILETVQELSTGDDDRRLIYAYEDYLAANDANKPSEIEIHKTGNDIAKVIHFLNKICVPDIMANSIEFENINEVENERLKICKILVTIDHTNVDKHEGEIEEILKSQAVNTVIKQIEQSKIYVDTPNIRIWAHKNLQTSYQRYINYFDIKIDFSHSINQLLKEVIEGRKSISEFSVPDILNEKRAILIDMLAKLMHEFFNNSAFGLDSYLSVRMRHGVIATQLREPPARNNIITQKKANSGEYEENTRWTSQIHDEERKRNLNKLLTSFSKSVDILIDEVSSQKIQIRDKKHASGLIQAILSLSVSEKIYRALGPTSSLDDFVDSAFEEFWTITRLNLVHIRHYISKELTEKFIVLFDGLHKNVGQLQINKELRELQSAINYAKLEMNQALRIFERWFQVAEGSSQDKISVEAIAIAAFSSVGKAGYTDVNPRLTFCCPQPISIYANKVTYFNDIFFVLFDNAMKRSGIKRKLEIIVDIEHQGKIAKFEVRNPISSSFDKKSALKTLDEIRNSIKDGSYISKINQEGKTGIRKLCKMVNSDIYTNNAELDFGISEKDEFYVTFKIEIQT